MDPATDAVYSRDLGVRPVREQINDGTLACDGRSGKKARKVD